MSALDLTLCVMLCVLLCCVGDKQTRVVVGERRGCSALTVCVLAATSIPSVFAVYHKALPAEMRHGSLLGMLGLLLAIREGFACTCKWVE